jgi:hypothetical protein
MLRLAQRVSETQLVTMGRLLQILGCVLMLGSIVAALGSAASADADILAPISQSIVAAVDAVTGASPAPSPSPSPSPTPSPTPGLQNARGGPLSFGLSGNLALGETSETTTFGQTGFFTPTPGPTATASGPFPFQQSATTANQNSSNVGAGLNADVSRRTATTYTDLKVPFGVIGRGESSIGVPQFIYSTPKYSLGYGAQPLLALGELQMGALLRGYSAILPLRSGQMTFFEGPGLGANAEVDRIAGMLAEESRGPSVFEGGLVYADGPETGLAKTVEFGGATAGRNLSLVGEGAWQTRSGGDGDPHGVAFQTKLDDNSKSGDCAATVRGVPDQFVTFSSGEIYSDKYGDLNCHSAQLPLFFDVNWEKTGDGIVGVTQQTIDTLSYSPTVKIGGLAFNIIRQNGTSVGQPFWSNTGTFALQTQVLKTNAVFGGQYQQSLDGPSSDVTRAINVSLRRSIGKHLSFGLSGQIQRELQVGATPSASPDAEATDPDTGLPVTTVDTGTASAGTTTLTLEKGIAFDLAQQWRKTTVQFGESITRTIAPTSDTLQQTPLLNLTRVISPVISVTTSLGYQILRDRLNPIEDGRNRILSIQLNAPFSYGNANVSGRADPRLPATISGRVLIAGSNQTVSNFASFANSGGIGNVSVMLDNKYVQRTDLNGGFDFSFVTPGQHQITIDSTSLPRGYTAAVPVQTITVQGGQQASISFSIGTFGGILGHVYGSDTAGNPTPLAGVQLRVDGGTYAQTDSTGAFGFGGLSAGQHEVTVIPNSIPATAQFSQDDLDRKVTVSDGTYATLDFHAQLLGSIEGKIVYAKDMGKDAGYGVLNAYVVAEPGEHAAIDEDDGSFIIDNLPAGDYTISADPETIGEGMGAAPQSVAVHLAPGEHYAGIEFLVGRFEKKVVFSLLSGSATPAPVVPTVRLSEQRLPPRGTTTVSLSAPADAQDVSATAFGKRITLAYDAGSTKWLGELEVPAQAQAGDYPVTGSVKGASLVTAASIKVDPKLPLVTVQYLTRATVGQVASVRVRFLVDARAGDRITWEDGTQTILGKPVSGRVFTFQKQLTLLPLHGLLLTRHGSIPIELL